MYANVLLGSMFIVGYFQLLNEPEIDTLDSFKFSDTKVEQVEERSRHALHYLSAAERFEFSRIGLSARFSRYFDALSLLVHDSNAEHLFKNLFNKGSDAAKVYALIGLVHLQKVQPEDPVFQALSHSNKKIVFLSGCVGYDAILSEWNFYKSKQYFDESITSRFAMIKNLPSFDLNN